LTGSNAFRQNAHQIVDWIADYFENIEKYPVKSVVAPGEILDALPDQAPQKAENFAAIMDDFQKIIMPGITHWQSPNFFAYFPANSSFPSVLAEMLTAALGTQCMVWETSPAAAELEERVMKWLKECMGLPASLAGVIQDTASTATLCAILTAREKASSYAINKSGFKDQGICRVYCSVDTHSSIAKAVKIAGLGTENLVQIGVDEKRSMLISELEKAIVSDIEQGSRPLCVIATLGTTSTTAIDPLPEIGDLCRRHGIWLHVDAAFAGTALFLPEYRWMGKGIENVDSFVFNPHKWLFTNFDCSAYFVKDKEALIRTFEILPEYLKTKADSQVNNYRDWGIPLGRRFRALKLWFVLRSFGVEGIQSKLRSHMKWARQLTREIESVPDFEMLAPVPLNTLCFRFKPATIHELKAVNELNERLLTTLNQSGKLYLTHTKINGIYGIRMVIGQTNVTQNHVTKAWERIKQTARKMREQGK